MNITMLVDTTHAKMRECVQKCPMEVRVPDFFRRLVVLNHDLPSFSQSLHLFLQHIPVSAILPSLVLAVFWVPIPVPHLLAYKKEFVRRCPMDILVAVLQDIRVTGKIFHCSLLCMIQLLLIIMLL